MHVVVVFHEVGREQQEEMREALVAYSQACLEREVGCQRYDVCLDPVEAGAFLLFQVYDDEAAYLAHREMPHYAHFRTLTDSWTRSRRVLTYRALTPIDGPEGAP